MPCSCRRSGHSSTSPPPAGAASSRPERSVEVLPEPPPYTFSLLVDEGGTGSCDYTTGGWEWVGVTSVEVLSGKWEPRGQIVFSDDGLWQAIDVPLDDDNLV